MNRTIFIAMFAAIFLAAMYTASAAAASAIDRTAAALPDGAKPVPTSANPSTTSAAAPGVAGLNAYLNAKREAGKTNITPVPWSKRVYTKVKVETFTPFAAPVMAKATSGTTKATPTISNRKVVSCADTNPAGYTEKGKVYGLYPNLKEFSFEDACITSYILRDYRCGGTKPYHSLHNCRQLGDYVCYDGACIPGHK